MLNDYIVEYIYIIDDLIKNKSFYKAAKENIAIDKDYVEYLLSRNTLFRDGKNKLKLWKQLNLTVTEEGRLTSKITLNGVRTHVVVFNMQNYKLLKEIQEETIHK
ncbi:MAG: hypothetical protein ABF289_06685 [Clostridiales bacterium]